ncbi:TPA: hypothetical protein P0N90_004298 [Yersinia enterocolitica]|uniref:hypothetical protein n=1 Tax=Yersinia enterocolitica TaxID=630 RepID=UPI002ACBB02D|nr:hypothetical protein [Yersinia enterocolitica]HDL7792716.1 hypothetical protein [Yersinia enterocolitica]HDL8193078.1 hypothetical protein [Yersinia enterocolitica]HDM8376474.1 hypothetical protein [Yersinia enterocolitica]HEN5460196.1 hypothetical protein [Yersinia enterocolitica]
MRKLLDSFTDERLKELSVEEDLYNFPPTQEELNSLARIALAAKRAEPVAWVVGDEEIADFKNGREVCVMRDCDDEKLDYLPLYTTPQFNSPDIPEGWKLVPIEPSIEMRQAFHAAYEDFENGIGTCPDTPYQAMLAAAPESNHD